MQIWREVLSLHDMAVDDNLYALGRDLADDIPPRRPHDRCGAALEAKHLLRHPSSRSWQSSSNNRMT